MRILGINGYYQSNPTRCTTHTRLFETAYYHDAAAVLIEDGVMVAGIEEERLTRVKHTGEFPQNAIKFCLKEAGLSFNDIDAVAIGTEGQGAHPEISKYRDSSASAKAYCAALNQAFPKWGISADKIHMVEHHVCHALSAIYASGYQDSLIVSVDAFGDGVALMVAEIRKGKFRVIRRYSPPETSLGLFYAHSLPYFGYTGFDVYKIMGLAAYGNASRFQSFFEQIVTLLPDGDFRIKEPAKMPSMLRVLGPAMQADDDFSIFYQDVAAAIQACFEKVLLHVLKYYREKQGLNSLCLVGGSAQNSTFNGRLAQSGLFDNIFIPAVPNDAGTAVGAAYFVQNLHFKGKQCVPFNANTGPFIGTNTHLKVSLAAWGGLLDYQLMDDTCQTSARMLADGKVLGWMQGRSEFGPRALSFRSILADPCQKHMQAKINRIVKEREGYRPFAPMVQEEHIDTYFDLTGTEKSLHLMSFTVPVNKNYRTKLLATTHVDGSARVQAVSKKINKRAWRLLEAFKEITDIPVLLNTSLNNHDEPIVNTVDEGIVLLLTSGLDCLVAGDYLITPKRRPDYQTLLNLAPRLRPNVGLYAYPASHYEYALLSGDELIPITECLHKTLLLSNGRETFSELFNLARVNHKTCDFNGLFELVFNLVKRRLLLLNSHH